MPSGNQLVASVNPSETNCFANLSHCNNFCFWLGRLLWIRDDESIHNDNEVCAWEKSFHYRAKNRNLCFKTRNGYKGVVQLSFAPSQFSTSLKLNHTARLPTQITKDSYFIDKEQAKSYFPFPSVTSNSSSPTWSSASELLCCYARAVLLWMPGKVSHSFNHNGKGAGHEKCFKKLWISQLPIRYQTWGKVLL